MINKRRAEQIAKGAEKQPHLGDQNPHFKCVQRVLYWRHRWADLQVLSLAAVTTHGLGRKGRYHQVRSRRAVADRRKRANGRLRCHKD
jgi:hypothetical protein